MENIELGYKIRQYRKEKKLTQQEVANLTNVSLKTIQRYEKGLNIPKSFLDIFYDKLNLEPHQGNSMNILFNGIIKNEHEEIKFYVTEILKEVGYEFIKIDEDNFNDFFCKNPDNIIIKNNITGDYFTRVTSSYNFDYSRVVFNFLKTLIEDDLKNATLIPPTEVDFFLSDSYQDFIKWYNAELSHLNIRNMSSEETPESYKEKLTEINKWRDLEINKRKFEFYQKKKRS